ncbi:hypothetical protein PG997_007726 [Apiospora hydei]|uniref:Uncharacterized protein n=1 Tax=Apiospora hydei TaxID=1337664 RepID=A0ABR1WCQ7_9PEZI
MTDDRARGGFDCAYPMGSSVWLPRGDKLRGGLGRPHVSDDENFGVGGQGNASHRNADAYPDLYRQAESPVPLFRRACRALRWRFWSAANRGTVGVPGDSSRLA